MKYIDEERWEKLTDEVKPALEEMLDMARQQVSGFNDALFTAEDRLELARVKEMHQTAYSTMRSTSRALAMLDELVPPEG